MTRIVDLTLTLEPGMRGVSFEIARTVERDGWNARTLHLYSHAGTHMDSQLHFAAGPETIDGISLTRCVRPCWVVNFEPVEPRQLLTVEALGSVEQKLRPGEGLILQTGWSRFCQDSSVYRDGLPRVSEALARWCADRSVAMLGVEPPSVADVNNMEELTRIHRILLKGNVVIVEGLANIDQLQEPKVLLIASPLKVAGGDGAPCRAFAIEGAEDFAPR